VTSGQDVLKALASGARACLIGKAFLYGLSALGGDGVAVALQIIRRELEVSMALTGVNEVDGVDARILVELPPGAQSIPGRTLIRPLPSAAHRPR
jgi:L-lactate dehydrogenase (cytochrome)